MFSNITRKAFIIPAFLVAGGPLLAAPVSSNPEPKGPAAVVMIVSVTPEYPAADEASNLLKQIQSDAVQLSRTGETLAANSQSGLSRGSQAIYLNTVRQQINQTGENLARLEMIKADSAPWQQQAITQLIPITQQLASDTEAAINHLNENPQYLFAPTYTQSLQAIAGGASDLKDRVNGFLSVAAIDRKADQLHEKAYQLELKADELRMQLPGSNL
jgi:predicted alpha/beta hydrolase family esterase